MSNLNDHEYLELFRLSIFQNCFEMFYMIHNVYRVRNSNDKSRASVTKRTTNAMIEKGVYITRRGTINEKDITLHRIK